MFLGVVSVMAIWLAFMIYFAALIDGIHWWWPAVSCSLLSGYLTWQCIKK